MLSQLLGSLILNDQKYTISMKIKMAMSVGYYRCGMWKKENLVERFSNLTVDQDHSYVANGFIVANCGAAGDAFAF